MNKREVIFLAGVAVAAVVFLYDRVAPALKANKDLAEQSMAETKQFIVEKEALLDTIKLRSHELVMLDMISQKCPMNPFARQWVEIIADQKKIDTLSNIEPILSYNGYMQAGDRYVAIVNDEDYVEGEKIEHVPLTIRTIDGERIDVENNQSRSKTKLSVKILPLEYEDE